MSADEDRKRERPDDLDQMRDAKPPALRPEKPVNLRRDMQMLLLVVGVFIVMIVAGAVYASRDDEGHTIPNNEPEHTKVFAYAAGTVTSDPVTYDEAPPVGGPYAPVWQNCGFYAGAIPAERAVHSLARGAVWVAYDPSLPQEEVAKLQEMAANNSHLLVSMMDGLANPIVASAWNHQLDFKVAGDPLLAEFVSHFQQGPEAPEQGMPCTGGSSEMAG